MRGFSFVLVGIALISGMLVRRAVGISRSFGAIAIATFLGLLLLTDLRAIAKAFGSDRFDRFPLLPFTLIGGFAVQVVGPTTSTSSSVAPSTTSPACPSTSSSPPRLARLSLATLGGNIASILILTSPSRGA